MTPTLRIATIITFLAIPFTVQAQGLLTPPGAPAPTMKTLQQVEPRTPIESLPFTITAGGSYYLTKNVGGSLNVDGITVAANGVTIDLNGFTLTGKGVASAVTVTGVRSNITVRNGSLTRWDSFGVNLGTSSDVLCENLHVLNTGTTAIDVGNGSRVLSCRVNGSGGHGIATGADSLVKDSVVTDAGNLFSGIDVEANSRVVDCVVSRSGDDGIHTEEHCLVSGCTAYNNTDSGIQVGNSSVVRNCVMNDNGSRGLSAGQGAIIEGCLARDNAFDGYYASFNSSFRNCTASRNGTQGFFLVGQSTIEECVASLNSADGIEAGNESRIVNNQCVNNGFGIGDGAGILVTGDHGQVEGNQVLRNDRGLEITGTSNDVLENKVRDNTDNYVFSAGNHLNLLLSQIPQTLSWPAHVQLAGSLTTAGPDDGITVEASNVMLDLGGHVLRATGGISGVNGTDGISILGTASNTLVRNGIIQGWPGYGIKGESAAVGVVLESLVVRDCVTRGASCSGPGLVARNCQFVDNADRGLASGSDALIESCLAIGNASLGFELGPDNVMRNCAAHQNEFGIVTQNRAQLVACKASGNSIRGMDLGFSSTADGCSSTDNGESGFKLSPDCIARNCVASKNGAHGFDAGARAVLENNFATANGQTFAGGAGFSADTSDNRLTGNTATFNPNGFIVESGFLTQNYAENNSTNYLLTACDYGAIVTDPGAAFVSSNPWVNFAKD